MKKLFALLFVIIALFIFDVSSLYAVEKSQVSLDETFESMYIMYKFGYSQNVYLDIEGNLQDALEVFLLMGQLLKSYRPPETGFSNCIYGYSLNFGGYDRRNSGGPLPSKKSFNEFKDEYAGKIINYCLKNVELKEKDMKYYHWIVDLAKQR
jgi:hypothetical protein